jgi:hypothetical protein
MFLLIFLIFFYLSLSIKTRVYMGIFQVYYVEIFGIDPFKISNEIRVSIFFITILFGMLFFSRVLISLIKMNKEINNK